MRVATYILLCLIWGSTWLAIKIGLEDAPPLTTAAIRFALATIVLGTIGLVRRLEFPQSIREIWKLGYPGIYMFGIGYGAVYLGEQYIDSALAAVLFASYPFFVALLSWVRYRQEKLSGAAWLGMLIGFAGVVLITYDAWQLSGDLLLGSLLVIGASFSAAYGIVIHKHYFAEREIVVSVTIQMIFGGILLFAGMLLFEDWADFHLTGRTAGSIVYLALFGTVVTFIGYYWLLSKTRAVTVSLIAFITPMVAIITGGLLAGESLTRIMFIGTAMILSGVALVTRR